MRLRVKKGSKDVNPWIVKMNLIMDVSVLFFGVLSDVTGMHRKHYQGIDSFADLKHRVEDDFPEIVHFNFRIAVNNKIVNEEPLLSQGDEIACLPPFAGG
jgi:molybdopterin converting factor small subunit